MSQQYITEEGQNFQWNQQAPKPKKDRKPLIAVAAGVAVLLLGFGVGNAAGASKIPDTVEVEKIVEKPVDKPVPYTPAVCSEALSLAGDVISSASRALGYSTDNLKAAADLDADRIRANTSKTEAETEMLKEIAPKYQSARDECLATVQ
ncbi:membrane protein [Arthrobacter phage Mimi]|nr:hypothetical protein PBI_MIMI_88 [Arthrobacter phage Mimi]